MFGLFSSKKAFNAQINSSETIIEVPSGENLLNSGLESGLGWPHNCRVGSCGTCRCRLLKGKIKPLNDFSYVLDKEELEAGMILACQSRLLSDIEIEIDLDTAVSAMSHSETVSGKIIRSRSLTHDILEISISLDKAIPTYLAGQYAEISIPSISHPRSYSFANAPSIEDPKQLSFYIRHVNNGEMTTWLHSEDRKGETISVTGPLGSFFLRESDSPILCIAGGSGLAPIKAIIDQLVHDGSKRQVTFLFGARTQKDLYCLDEMESIQQSHPDTFTFTPILSDEPMDSDWSGLRGLVTEYITQLDSDITTYQAYLCGPPPMIDSAIEVLSSAGLEDEDIFFDKFLDATHLPGGRR